MYYYYTHLCLCRDEDTDVHSNVIAGFVVVCTLSKVHLYMEENVYWFGSIGFLAVSLSWSSRLDYLTFRCCNNN